MTVAPEFDDESDEDYEGIVQHVNVINLKKDEFSIVLRNCKNCAGKDLPGNQTYGTESIRELVVLKEGDGRKASPPAPSSTSRTGATNGYSNGRSGRQMGQQQHFRNDNQHLKNLHPVQVKI